MTRIELQDLITDIESPEGLLATLKAKLATYSQEYLETRNTWAYHMARMVKWMGNDMEGPLPFVVFNLKGNSKLPFAQFSSLALADCPGKGACAKFCYSLTGWRYPAAFFRQLQNSLLLRFNKGAILQAFDSMPSKVTKLRLYVDGDFPSVEVLAFWMDLIKTRPSLAVYGYSKSWAEFVALAGTGYQWPDNYLTNASGGSRHNPNSGIARAFLALPVVRGSFEALPVARHHIKSRAYQDKTKEGSRAYRAEVLAKLKALQAKAFACPGNCGNCLPNGRHACGDESFKGVAIGIGIHA
jgi:hypothetical protein